MIHKAAAASVFFIMLLLVVAVTSVGLARIWTDEEQDEEDHQVDESQYEITPRRYNDPASDDLGTSSSDGEFPTCPYSTISGFFDVDVDIENLLSTKRCIHKEADIQATIRFSLDQINMLMSLDFTEEPHFTGMVCREKSPHAGTRRRLPYRWGGFRGGGACSWCRDSDSDDRKQRDLLDAETSRGKILAGASGKTIDKLSYFLDTYRTHLQEGLTRNLFSSLGRGICFEKGELPEVKVRVQSSDRKDTDDILSRCNK